MPSGNGILRSQDLAQKKGFGLDIGQNTIKLVELRKDRSGVHLHRSKIAKTGVTSSMSKEERSSAISNALGNVLKGVLVGHDPVAVATPGLSAFIRYVKLPHVNPSRLKQIISYEAQQQVPFPLNEVIWDYQVLKEKDKASAETNVVLVAIKKDVLDAHISSVNAHGIAPSFVEHRPLAVYNSIKFNEETGEDETSVIIDVGERTTDISVEKEGELCWTRSARIGGMDVTEALRKSLNVSFEEAERIKEEETKILLSDEEEKNADDRTTKLWGIAKKPLSGIVSEIQRSVNYFQTQLGGTRADKIILTGGCTRMENFDSWISSVIAGPQVSLLNPLRKISCPKGFLENTDIGSQLDVAVGLALRSLGEGFSTINLLPSNILNRQELKKKRAYIALSGVSMALMLGISSVFSTANHNVLKEKLKVISEELEEYRGFDRAIEEHRARNRKIEEKLGAMQTIIKGSWKWPDLLLEISRVIPQGVVLSELGFVSPREERREAAPERRRGVRDEPAAARIIEPAVSGRVLELKGAAKDFKTIENLIARTEGSSLFKNVKVISATAGRSGVAGADSIDFVIHAEVTIDFR